MSSELLLRVVSLERAYRSYETPKHRLFELLGIRRPVPPKLAVNNVSFELRRGEILGLIGPNGAGKSTLLQMIAGTLRPTGGTLEVHGRVTALLELGAGVDPELTGRENIRLMGAMYGLSDEEVDRRFDAIADFSELGEALDDPVKTYSSGMFLRLAFSVSTAMEPDLLIVDEALAVGDVGFQAKCLDRLEKLIDGGASIVLAAHDLQLIKNYCTSAICLNKGSIEASGDPETVVEHYYYLVRQRGADRASSLSWRSAESGVRFGSEQAFIDSVEVCTDGDAGSVRFGQTLPVMVRANVPASYRGSLSVAIVLRDIRGYNLYGLVASEAGDQIVWRDAQTVEARFSLPMRVADGEYSLTVRLEKDRSESATTLLDKHVGVCRIVCEGSKNTFLGSVDLGGCVVSD
ncbi:ABC transporter ATP-binding protein [Thauera sp. CAU 1555]|uniref:ABC transporter ATP-binding protein n=1 Tax=Thauera sedimentorum TaxID=2767595 RepID=A0ABR9B4W8_9RHOO|nr:ABC transporter ATP-binding protein [Thauera sedimentorum]MBC9070392.1 ABC transporter ATP-binding protein [Thauera sedimentorum]MBD8501312.1 ABC transporter ATP-binding protein [Thauera sedimentorum]